jgi:hypothetical protein
MGGNTPSSIPILITRIRLNCQHYHTQMRTAKISLHRLFAKKTGLASISAEVGLLSSQVPLYCWALGLRQKPMTLAYQTSAAGKHFSMSDRIDLRMPARIVVIALNHLQAEANISPLRPRPLGEEEIRTLNHMEDGNKTEQAARRQARACKPRGGRVFPPKTGSIRTARLIELILSPAFVVVIPTRRTLLG